MRTRTDVMMNQTKAKSALLIAGPTASGKSALALTLARERDGVIINADALQVYGTAPLARPTDELRKTPHQLYGHVSGLVSTVTAWLPCQNEIGRRESGPPLSSAAPGFTSRHWSAVWQKFRPFLRR
jgi:hypothetical protein